MKRLWEINLDRVLTKKIGTETVLRVIGVRRREWIQEREEYR